MKGIILTAGLGTRLRPLTDHLPKPLLPVGGRPIIEYNLALLKYYGVHEVTINLHYQSDKIKQVIGDGRRLGMQISYSEEPEILGTGGGIKKIYEKMGQDAAIVMNGDILIDLNIEELLLFHRENGGAATLVLREDEAVEQFGAIEIDQDCQIKNILGKIEWRGERTHRLMFTGVHIIEPAVVTHVPEGCFFSIIDAYVQMLKQGEHLFGYQMEGYWNDIGVIGRYEQAKQDIEKRRVVLKYLPQ